MVKRREAKVSITSNFNKMRSLKYLIISLIAIFMLSCKNDDKAIRQMCEEMHENYPLATLQDIYKTCYQDFFGAEHLMNDTAAARHYIYYELEQCRDTDMSAMPKYEPTGFRHRFVRVNFSCLVDGEITEEQLLTMFIDAAGKDNAFSNNWAAEWYKIEKTALEVNPQWSDDWELLAELREAAAGNYAVRHSDAFRENYNPHYRIVRASSVSVK